MMRLGLLLSFCLLFTTPFHLTAQDNSGVLQPLEVSENGRFLVQSDGTPFFYLGDTAWELFHRLSREDAEFYLETRRQQGFTVIQAVALAELNGLLQGNVYDDTPFVETDPTQPLTTPGANPDDAEEYDYWDHVDWIISKAAEKGLYVSLFPTWGDKVYPLWSPGPPIFDAENAQIYGEFIGDRYQEYTNLIWILGGDRDPIVGRRGRSWSVAKGLPGAQGTPALVRQWRCRTTDFQRDRRRVRAWRVLPVLLGCVIVAGVRLQVGMDARCEALGLGDALQKRDELRAV